MQYKVACANRETGAEFFVLVDAGSEREAVQAAAAQGHIAGHAAPMVNQPDRAAEFQVAQLAAMRRELQQINRKTPKTFSIVRVIALFIVVMIILVVCAGVLR